MIYKTFFLIPVMVSFFIKVCIAQSPVDDKYVIVLDIQKHFTNEVLADDAAEELIGNINQIIKEVDNEHIIYVESILKALSISLKGFQVDTLSNLELDERLVLKNNHVFQKSKPNAFEVAELYEFLQQKNAKDIVVVGLMAEHCVYSTLLGGKERGYAMYVIPEAIAAKSKKSKEKIVNKLTKNGIEIIHL